jgi:hypothetical protein
MRRRCQPCWSCDRPTAPAELVETHVRGGQASRPGWWLAADRVVWLCPRCAAPLRKPARPYPTRGGDFHMAPIDLVNLAAVLVALLPAVVIAWALATWLRRRTGTSVAWHCNQCPAHISGLPRHKAQAWARQHAAEHHAAIRP